MIPRLAAPAICGLALIGGTSALAATPLALTLTRANGVGYVTLSASTRHLQSRLWVQRTGGSTIARGSGDVSCEQKTNIATLGSSEMFTFTLAPNGRETLWHGGSGSCVVTVSIRGQGRLAAALRGY
jgi:hypothetical protein